MNRCFTDTTESKTIMDGLKSKMMAGLIHDEENVMTSREGLELLKAKAQTINSSVSVYISSLRSQQTAVNSQREYQIAVITFRQQVNNNNNGQLFGLR